MGYSGVVRTNSTQLLKMKKDSPFDIVLIPHYLAGNRMVDGLELSRNFARAIKRRGHAPSVVDFLGKYLDISIPGGKFDGMTKVAFLGHARSQILLADASLIPIITNFNPDDLEDILQFLFANDCNRIMLIRGVGQVNFPYAPSVHEDSVTIFDHAGFVDATMIEPFIPDDE